MIQIDKSPTCYQILRSIRENKENEKRMMEEKVRQASQGWIAWVKSFFYQPLSLEEIRKTKLAELRNPRDFAKMRTCPSLQSILNKLNASSNYFSLQQKKYIENLERFYFPQANKTKIGYELLEHLSNRFKEPGTLATHEIHIDGETFEVLDGHDLQHPIFVHATKMATAPLILNNLGKFFGDNVKLSLSLFETGKMFFHSNDPTPPLMGENFILTDDFYVALGLSVDPKNFYRNYHEDVGSPTYNRDPNIATKGGNDLVHVESHIKMNKILGLLGTYVHDVLQRCYMEIGHVSTGMEGRDDVEPARVPYSNTDRMYRLERELISGQMVDDDKNEINHEYDRLIADTRRQRYHLRQHFNGMINGEKLFNIQDEVAELIHLANTKPLSSNLGNEIRDLNEIMTHLHRKHDGVWKFLTSTIGFKIKMLFHYCLGPIYNKIPSLRRLLYPYHLINFAGHRLIRFLGPTELLKETRQFSYNEYEAYSHDLSKESEARPIAVKYIVMSRVAFNQLQNETAEKRNQFKVLAQTAREKGLPIILVDTTTKNLS